jgi:RNA polymerase sigma-70 factor (ECF subfamily)
MVPEQDRSAIFFRHFAPVQGRIFAFILTLLPNRSEAEDVFQETCLALWRDFEQFDPAGEDSDFFRWASRVAHHRVLAWCKKRQSLRHLSPECIEAIAGTIDNRKDALKQRLDLLEACMDKLTEPQRQLVQLRYGASGSAGSIREHARKLGRPDDTLYKTLNRIRRQLLECVNRSLRLEGLE